MSVVEQYRVSPYEDKIKQLGMGVAYSGNGWG